MNCEELIHYLSDYIDNGLTEKLRVDAEEHLATCRNCHVVLDTTRQTIVLFKETQHEGIPVDRRSALFAQLEKALAARRSARGVP
ncbi:MAG TPA: zf-HC2 domain-containing protein [Anaerolineales bacterium]|nr:zf-HC2 domain-containing protein [Anaerolineales bacterium]